ncbi:MAG: hypothetical protein ACT4OJ_08845 [Bacteroidota bacterium]
MANDTLYNYSDEQMNRRIDFTKLGGYPLAQEDLDWMQTSYRVALSALANMVGDKVILYGMVEGGGAVTAGWISIGGELVPFSAGIIGTGEFTIVETVTPLTFNDGNSKDVLFERVAQFSAGGAYQYSDLKRIDTLKLGLVPKGLISMWSGLIAEIPTGWALCDGANGTPNLSGRFIAGYDAGDADYNAIGDTGGAKTVTLIANQQGKLNARAMVDDIGGGTASVIARLELGGIEISRNGGSNQSSWGSSIQAPLSDAAASHENRPPYYTLAYIIKL